MLTDQEAAMYAPREQLTDEEEKAWGLYCDETAGAMSAADFWHELPSFIQEMYMNKITFIPEKVLDDNEERAQRYIREREIHIFPIDTSVLFAMIAEIRYHRSKGN